MTDHAKLKRLAEAALKDNGDYVALNDYGMAVPPRVVLALLTEIDSLRKERDRLADDNQAMPEAPGDLL